MISGTSGQFIAAIPKTVLLVLTASLFVSLFMLPVFGVLFFRLFPPQSHRESKLMNQLKDAYSKFMTWTFVSRLRIYGLLAASFALMIFSFWLPASGRVSVEVFPSGDANYFTALIEAPSGTDLATMKKLVPALDEVFLPYFDEDDKWLKNFQVSVGERSPYDPNQDASAATGSEENLIGITINLYDGTLRETLSTDAAPKVKKDLVAALPDYLEITITELASGPPGGSQPIVIEMVSDDLNRIDTMIEQLVPALEKVELEDGSTLKNIKDNQGDPVPQMNWRFDREKLNRYGLSPSQLQQTLRAGIQGITILEITENGEEIDVDARFDFGGNRTWESPESLDVVAQIPIKTPTGDFIKLSDVADFNIQAERTQFKHEDGKRSVSVGAGIEGEATAAQFTAVLNEIVDELPTQPGDSISLGGDNEETNRLVTEMALSMGLAVFLILLILVLQFDSFLQSSVIIMLLPLSLMAVFIGFWLSGTPVGFPTMIGIVALAGIIVNDSIVLIDRINRNVKEMDGNLYAAYIDAGVSRMQPIILTSITTIFGLLPLALSDPIWAGLGFAIIYGMTLATFLTVILVPCLLIMYQDITNGIVFAIKWPFKKAGAFLRAATDKNN